MKMLRTCLIVFILSFFICLPAFAAESKGVLYFIEGGTGAGVAHLYSDGKLIKLHYSEYKEYGFEGREGYKYGAVWNVRYHMGQSGKNIVDSIEFTGKYDNAVKAADELVRNHYRLLVNKEYQKAYNNLSPAWKKSQSFDSFVKGIKSVKFKDSAGDPPSFALKIIGHNPGEVLVLVNSIWFYEGNTDNLKYEVKKINNRWYIDRVTPITLRQWDES